MYLMFAFKTGMMNKEINADNFKFLVLFTYIE